MKKKLLSLWWLWAPIIGFIACGGWEPIVNFSDWQYGVFIHANGNELLLFVWWLLFGPLPGAIIALGLAALAQWLYRKNRKSAH